MCLQSSPIYHVHFQNFCFLYHFFNTCCHLFLPYCLVICSPYNWVTGHFSWHLWCMYCVCHVDEGLMAFVCIWYATGFMIMNICCPWVVCFFGLLAELLQQMAVNYHTHLGACSDSISCLFGVCCADNTIPYEFSLLFYSAHHEPCYVKPRWTWMLWEEIKLLLFSHCILLISYNKNIYIFYHIILY